ncbi:MAG: hypothetical protein FD180_4925, partial [Planctomycetota bacterium]
RAAIAALRATNPEAARLLERLADRLAAGSALLVEAALAGSSAGAHAAPAASSAGEGALDNPRALPDTAPPAIAAIAPADPFAFQQANWPPDYDSAVTHYFHNFSEDLK